MKVFGQGIALALIGLACTAVSAQDAKLKDRETPAQKRADRAEGRADRLSTAAGAEQNRDDRAIAEYFAGKLMLMDQSTIQLAQLAVERSTNESVKQFASMLVEEHTKCSEKLRECAPEVVGVTELNRTGITHAAGFRGAVDADEKSDAVDNPAKGGRKPARNPARKPDGAARLRESDPADKERADDRKRLQETQATTSLHRILNIERQATEHYVQSTTEMLSSYQGQEFDMGFLGFTIGSHTWAIAELKALNSVGDDKFQKLISDATTKVQQHMARAEELSRELGADSAQAGNTTRTKTANENAPVPEN